MKNKKTLMLAGTVVAVLIGGVGVSLAFSDSSAKKNENPTSVTTTALNHALTFGIPTTVLEQNPSKDSRLSASTTSTSVSQPANAISGVISDDDDEQEDDD